MSFMHPAISLQLNTQPAQFDRLCRLQAEFSAACNLVAPIARDNRCWNRVALHHLTYRLVRNQFPQLGSQMACNAIYSVARTYRAVLQHKQSPWNIEQRPQAPLPQVRFTETAPVYFDRHTLSLRNGLLSMFTLDGRLHFELNLTGADAASLLDQKIREIVLLRKQETFMLQIWLDEKSSLLDDDANASEFPQYLLITPTDALPDAMSAEAADQASRLPA
ncbi:hypothetical protein MASR1M60_01880 [Rhodocyclaceae bacterium]